MCSAVIYKKVLGWPKASFRYELTLLVCEISYELFGQSKMSSALLLSLMVLLSFIYFQFVQLYLLYN